MKSIKDEIKRCFKENPDLIYKRLEDIGEFFYIQGILYQSNALEAARQKVMHYKKHLDDSARERADKAWEEAGV